MIFALLALHAALAAVAPPLARRIGRRVLLLAASVPALTVLWGSLQTRRILQGDPRIESLHLAPSLGFELSLRVDPFGLLMVWVVSGIGTLVFVYAFSYFSKPRDDLGKFTSALVAFAGSMLGLVVSDNLLGLFFFWEATSIASYLLIGFNDRSEQARAAALQALLTTGLGGLAMLAGFVIVGRASGTYAVSAIVSTPPSGLLVEVGLVCILVGTFTKSAQAPFHSWLPSAMVAPTPVSTYLHSATMVKAGVFLIARLSSAFAGSVIWRPFCVTAGLATMILGAYRALRQFDLKLLLAYATVSQLGLMVVLFGLGDARSAFAGIAVMVAHAFYKAALFMSAGIVDRTAGTRDIRQLDGVGRAMPAVLAVSAVAAASMAGIPPLLGFVAKEEALSALVRPDYPFSAGPTRVLVIAAVVTASAMTVAYALRFSRGAFASRSSAELAEWGTPAPKRNRHPKPGRAFLAPSVVLSAAGLAGGAYPPIIGWILSPAANALYPASEAPHLEFWHGPGLPLVLSAVTLIAGSILFAARGWVERVQRSIPRVPGSLEGYRGALDLLLKGASRTTGIAQCGSVPVYLAVIALALVSMPGVPLMVAFIRSAKMPPSRSPEPLTILVAASTVFLALGIATTRRRFPAVVMLGGVGYGVGVLFVIHGAPDLALTQFLIETLMLIVFVLVLRHLPSEFTTTPLRGYTALRLAISTVVAAFVFTFAMVAAAARDFPPISREYFLRALPEAHARNVVNSILVDFRALDTIGEITVLAAAAMGIAALAMASRGPVRPGTRQAEGDRE